MDMTIIYGVCMFTAIVLVLVAIILLPGNPVLTYQITNLIDPKGGNWHLLTAAAFLSMIVPMLVFLAFQRYFVRGMLAGAVKG